MAPLGVADRVREQVAEDLLELGAVGLEARSAGEAVRARRRTSSPLPARGLGLDGGEALGQRRLEGEPRDLGGGRAGVDPGQVEQVVEQVEHVADRVADGHAGRFSWTSGSSTVALDLDLEQLGGEDDGVERSARVVRAGLGDQPSCAGSCAPTAAPERSPRTRRGSVMSWHEPRWPRNPPSSSK